MDEQGAALGRRRQDTDRTFCCIRPETKSQEPEVRIQESGAGSQEPGDGNRAES